MRWFKEGVGGRSDPAAGIYTIEDHLQMHEITTDRMILKMDVEGAEYEALGAVSGQTLRRFDQIIIEIHGLRYLGNIGFRRAFARVFEMMNAHHTLFHVHANNYRGFDGLAIVEGMQVANILELSYVLTSRVDRGPSKTIYPTPLDAPNRPHPELPLLFYPFVPTSLGIDRFCATARQLRARRDDAAAASS